MEEPCLGQIRIKNTFFSFGLVAFVLLIPSAFGQTNPGSPTSVWTPVLYGNGNFPDPTADQQTGSAESDIVGNLGQPSLYMQYNSGYMGFRLRLGADAHPAGFKGDAFVGLDANLNGSLDLFVGVDNQGSKSQLGLWYAGTGLNTSPNTTTIANTALTNYQETAENYGFASVTAANDPAAVSFDLNGDGKTDQFLTFYIPFVDMAAALAACGINFDTNTIMILVAATATQPNSLNQDLNGVSGDVNSSQSWAQLGAASLPYSPISLAPVPEPAPAALLGAAGLAMMLCRRPARRRG